MKSLILILTFAFFAAACSEQKQEPPETPETIRAKHAENFAALQNYVNTHYSPEWKVKGARLDKNLNGVSGQTFYYVLLSKGQTEKVINVIVADFELADGTTAKEYFEPPESTRTNEK